jgi:glucose/arabinose dehydrogenase
MKKTFLLIIWVITVIYSALWTFENPEKIEKIKSEFAKNKQIEVRTINSDEKNIPANSFTINISQVLENKSKTAFVIHPDDAMKFNSSNLTIYTQTGFVIKNNKAKKLNLPNYFTLQRNGGVKTIISLDNKSFALISGNENDCYFASIITLNTGKEIFRTKCLPAKPKNNDFNGLGSSNVHLAESILFSLGTPEKQISKNSLLAQKNDSMFGKILEIKKKDLIKVSKNNNKDLTVNIFSKGHRVPQGLTILKNKIYNTEHGPKGGDELNLVSKNKNYGWPIVSYGTNYLKENGGNGKSIIINHENQYYEEPLFAFVPSVGISALNNCPSILNNYYKKPCLMALSLYGNDLRKGHSLIIFLLSESQDKIQSIEKIVLEDLILRHFVTNEKNIIYEDEEGNIYVSADKKGIYKIKFENFR